MVIFESMMRSEPQRRSVKIIIKATQRSLNLWPLIKRLEGGRRNHPPQLQMPVVSFYCVSLNKRRFEEIIIGCLTTYFGRSFSRFLE